MDATQTADTSAMAEAAKPPVVSFTFDESALAFDFDGGSEDDAVCVAANLPESERTGLQELRQLAIEAASTASEDSQRWASRRSILLRFLRTSREREVQHGLDQLTRTIKWRDEQNVSQILSNPEADKEELACRRLLKYSMHFDKAGRPMLFQRIGAWSPSTLCSAIGSNKEALIRGHILMNERLACLATQSWIEQRAEAEKNGSTPSPTPPMLVLVIDMQDLTFELMTNGGTIFPVVQELFTIDGDYYPETTYRVFIVNAPMAFTALWGAIKYMVHPDSREKIFVLGIEESHPELIELCGAECVPKELGGDLVGAAPYCEGESYDGAADPTIFKVEQEIPA